MGLPGGGGRVLPPPIGKDITAGPVTLGGGFGFTTGVGGLTGEKAGGISATAGTGNAPGVGGDAMASGGGGGSRSLVVTGLAPSGTIGSGMADGLVA